MKWHTEISKWQKWLHCTCICLQTLFTIVFFGKMKKSLTKPFTFKKRTPIENERKSWKITTYWKWTHILKKNYILKMFLEKWKAINHFLKKLQLANSLKKIQECLLAPNSIDWYLLIQSSSLLSLKKSSSLGVTSSRITGSMSNCEWPGLLKCSPHTWSYFFWETYHSKSSLGLTPSPLPRRHSLWTTPNGIADKCQDMSTNITYLLII